MPGQSLHIPAETRRSIAGRPARNDLRCLAAHRLELLAYLWVSLNRMPVHVDAASAPVGKQSKHPFLENQLHESPLFLTGQPFGNTKACVTWLFILKLCRRESLPWGLT
jgi:hypothetical protein